MRARGAGSSSVPSLLFHGAVLLLFVVQGTEREVERAPAAVLSSRRVPLLLLLSSIEKHLARRMVRHGRAQQPANRDHIRRKMVRERASDEHVTLS